MIDHIEFLKDLEYQAAGNHTQELYLWPRTPISNLQAEAWQRVGVSDWREDDARSRPAQIIETLESLIYNRLVSETFTILDVCCGDGVILWQIKRRFPWSSCLGVELNTGRLPAHSFVQDMGVRLFRVPIQRLFKADSGTRFDIVVMLNTYRGWSQADLHRDEMWIVADVDEWLARNARFAVLTATEGQIQDLKHAGFWVTVIGKGENGSALILTWPCATGELGELWREKRP